MTHVSDWKMFFRSDPKVEAARKLPGWKEFHKACSDHGLFFDDITSSSAKTFTCDERYRVTVIARGRGTDVLSAMMDALAKSEKWAGIPEIERARDVLLGLSVNDDDDYERLLG